MNETFHTAKTGVAYRLASELYGERTPGPDAESEVLRTLDISEEVHGAGLYPGFEPAVDDHWAHGTLLTSEVDAEIARRKIGVSEEKLRDALLAIAYTRIESYPDRTVGIWLPARFKQWWVQAPYFSKNFRMTVWTPCAGTAKVAVAVRMLDTPGTELRAIAAE